MSNDNASSTLPQIPCERDGVLQLLPHRDPFVWVSRIVSCDPGERIVCEFDVREDLPLFTGHFPEYPVLPGVIIMEALAQASCCCLMLGNGEAGSLGFFAGIDKAKFRNQVRPGDTLRLESVITRNNPRMCVAEVAAYVGDTLCAQATQKYVMQRKPVQAQ